MAGIQVHEVFQRSPRFMIHTCNKREWYVYDFLIPSLVQQGIKNDQIKVWHDYGRLGNLKSFLNSIKWITQNCNKNEAIWHLQDDIIISEFFRQQTEKEYEGVACGFICRDWNFNLLDKIGRVPTQQMWHSFPCIRIPNLYAKEFYDWLYNEALFEYKFFQMWKEGKNDDTLFYQFMTRKHNREHVYNIAPNIVDHIDFLIGWSVINKTRGDKERRAEYWKEQEKVRELANKLKEIGKYVE